MTEGSAEQRLSPEPKEPQLSIKQEQEEFPFHTVTIKTKDDEGDSKLLHRKEPDGPDCGVGCSSEPLTQLPSDSEERPGNWSSLWDMPLRTKPDTDCPLRASRAKTQPLTCSWCGKEFVRHSELQRHVLTHTGQKPFQCPFCAQSFCRKSNLKRHTRVHTGEKPFICALCHNAFAYKQNLDKHTCFEGDKPPPPLDEGRPHRCSQCGKGFTRLSNLHIHRLVHTQERTQKCSICDRAFKQKASLTRHLKIHHIYSSVQAQAAAEEESVLLQKCPKCGKEFSRKYNVKQHMRTHLGEKPFACTICSQGFTVKNNVKVHMVTHFEEKCYKCPFCEDGSMKRHMAVHS